MERFWEFWFEMFRYGEELFIISMVLSLGTKQKSRFWWRVSGCGLLFALLPLPFAALLAWSGNAFVFSAIGYAILLILCLGALFFCRKVYVTNLIFTFFSAFGTRMFATSLRSVLRVLITGSTDSLSSLPWMHPIYYVLLAGTCALVYFLFTKPILGEEKLRLNAQVIVYYLLILTINIMLNTIRMITENLTVATVVLLEVSSAMYYMLIVCTQSIIVRQARAQVENIAIQRMWEQDKSQYTVSRETMDALRTQHHDLKHIVAHLKAEKVNDEYVGALEKVMNDYSVYVDCGNKILDVVLSEKKRLCNYNGIAMTISADGAVISFMNSVDVYSLFGNALDNAVNYLKTFEDSEKKFINLIVCEERGMALIRIENYFEGTLKLKNGLPVTTQEDENYHGFGMKSMSQLAKKYQGVMTVSADNNLFTLKFVFPVPSVK